MLKKILKFNNRKVEFDLPMRLDCSEKEEDPINFKPDMDKEEEEEERGGKSSTAGFLDLFRTPLIR